MLTVINPATEEPLAELEQAGVEETDAAVARAKEAFPAWKAVGPSDRARLLRRLATLVEEHGEELARIESRNVGKPISGARAEVGMVAQVFHFYAGAIDKHYGESIPVDGGVDVTFHEEMLSGKFHGTIRPTTPSGSRNVTSTPPSTGIDSP